jgi:hypothetical protein
MSFEASALVGAENGADAAVGLFSEDVETFLRLLMETADFRILLLKNREELRPLRVVERQVSGHHRYDLVGGRRSGPPKLHREPLRERSCRHPQYEDENDDGHWTLHRVLQSNTLVVETSDFAIQA